jgi:hypothetical protein
LAAIDLSDSVTTPLVYRQALSTNWQEFKLPPWARKVSVQCSAAIVVSFIGDQAGTQPADGNAASGTTHYWTQAADAAIGYAVRDPGDRPRETGMTQATSIFIASASGTPTVELIIEQAGF